MRIFLGTLFLFFLFKGIFAQTPHLELVSKTILKSKYGRLDSLMWIDGDHLCFIGDQKKISATRNSNCIYTYKKNDLTKPVKSIRYNGKSTQATKGLNHFKTLKIDGGIINVWEKNLKEKTEVYMEVLDLNFNPITKLKKVLTINNMDVAAMYQALVGGNYTMGYTNVECNHTNGKVLFVYPIFEKAEQTDETGYFVLNKDLTINYQGKYSLKQIVKSNPQTMLLGTDLKREGFVYNLNTDGTFLISYFETFSFKNISRKKEIDFIVNIDPNTHDYKVLPLIGNGYKIFGASFKFFKDKCYVYGVYKSQEYSDLGNVIIDLDLNKLKPISIDKKKLSVNQLSEINQSINTVDDNGFFVDNIYNSKDGNTYAILSSESYEVVSFQGNNGVGNGTDNYITKQNFSIICADPFGEINWVKNYNRSCTYNSLNESNNDVKVLSMNNKCFVFYMNKKELNYSILNNTTGAESSASILDLPENKKGYLFSGEFVENNNELYGVAIKSNVAIQHVLISIVGAPFIVPGLTYWLIAKNRAQFYKTKMAFYKISLK